MTLFYYIIYETRLYPRFLQRKQARTTLLQTQNRSILLVKASILLKSSHFYSRFTIKIKQL